MLRHHWRTRKTNVLATDCATVRGRVEVSEGLRLREGNRKPGSGQRKPARFVAIAGNIGAGKSTLSSFLETRFGIQPFYEPNENNPYLGDFYEDMERYAFHSQMYFLAAKFRAHLQLARMLEETPSAVFVQDRTIYEDAEIFCRTLWRSKLISKRDYELYMGMYEGIRDALPRPDLLIFLRCSLRGIRRRIRHRGRVDEQAIDPDYLKRLQRAYNRWYQRYDLGPSLVIETEQLHYLDDLFDHTELIDSLQALLGKDGRGELEPGDTGQVGAIVAKINPIV